MDNSNIISEVEILNSDDYILIEHVCEALDNINIPYIKTTNKSAKAGLNVNYNYIGKIVVSSENKEKAIQIVNDIIESNKGQIDSEDLPEELRDVDETYYEDLVKKGKLSSYQRNDGTEIVRKSAFIKKLKEEKNEILKDKKIIRYILILIIPLVLLEIAKYFYRHINDFSVQNIRYVIILVGLIPVIFINIMINKKVKRMYKKYINKEEYQNTEKRINKIFLIGAMLISIICLSYSLDWTYSVVTGNRPLFSIQYAKEWEFGGCYHSIFYNYYSLKNGRKEISNKQIYYYYEMNYEDGSKINLDRIELIKDKIYIGIPSFLKEMERDYKIEGTKTHVLGVYGIQYKEDNKLLSGCTFMCYSNYENLKNTEINNKLNNEAERIKRDYKDILINYKTHIESVDNKNIGVIEYSYKYSNKSDEEDNQIFNTYYFFFEYKGKKMECNLTTLNNEPLDNNYWGETILKTLEVYD